LSAFNDGAEPEHSTSIWLKIGSVALVVLLVYVFFHSMSSDGNSGLLGGSCGSNEDYKSPKDQLKGVKVTASVQRCNDETASGKARTYVLLHLSVHGSTNDSSDIKSLPTRIQLDGRLNGAWQKNVPQSDTPQDSGKNISGNSVAYETRRRWNIRHVPTNVTIAIMLRTKGKNPKSRVSHVFHLP
jgi:hypothetical protein